MSGTAPNNAHSQTLKKNVTIAAAVVVVMNLVAKVLGFLREMVIARVYGATMFTDAYLVAYSLPFQLCFDIFSGILSKPSLLASWLGIKL